MEQSTHIPAQSTGIQKDYEATREYETEEVAYTAYQIAASRVLNPAAYHRYHKLGTIGTFVVCGANGAPTHALPEVGNYLRIASRAPNNPEAEAGEDWVCIEAIERDVRDRARLLTSMTVRTCEDPRAGTGHTAHFFADSATSTFQAALEGRTVTASIHGRNEQPNTGEELSLLARLRNLFIALGAFSGGALLIWQPLCEGFLEE